MIAPKTFVSLLAAASAALALPGSVMQGAVSEHALEVRQDAPVTVLVNTDTESVDFSFTPFPAAATTRSLQRRNAFGTVLGGVRDLIIALNAEDLEKRERLTKEVSSRIATEFPGNAVVVTNVGFDFTDGEILEQDTIRFDAKIGATVTFEVLRFQKGTFTLKGDGGFINWAWSAPNPPCTGSGKTVSCI
ncbi:hypothetical protein F5X68DRAFT_237524 [Plectosphaerella plurivora]|uniref:Chalcone isomerase domain-containing protein n=1 Tax=Plectosphaerella plurivora TaxID=936078 RepID=A0A9P8UYS7_9PEZI|nr:hypothetical protein F5X68DRAFT_237524 [Plectosphaerella plurivora]